MLLLTLVGNLYSFKIRLFLTFQHAMSIYQYISQGQVFKFESSLPQKKSSFSNPYKIVIVASSLADMPNYSSDIYFQRLRKVIFLSFPFLYFIFGYCGFADHSSKIRLLLDIYRWCVCKCLV